MKKIFTLFFMLFSFTIIICGQTNSISTLDVLKLGNYDEYLKNGDGSKGVYDGSFYEYPPTTFYLKHTGTQMIYLKDELTPIAGKTITSIKYIFFNSGVYSALPRNIKAYLLEIDDSSFSYNSDAKSYLFFNYKGIQPSADFNYDHDFVEEANDNGELEIPLKRPFVYSGKKNLLIVLTFDGTETNNGSLDLAFYKTDKKKRVMIYTSDKEDFDTFQKSSVWPKTKFGCGVNLELPVTQFSYQNNTTSGILFVGQKTSTSVMYDLKGKRVSKNYKGLVIQDGKKFLKK